MHASSQRNNITYFDETKKMAHDWQRVRAKENLMLRPRSVGPRQRQASGTNPPMTVLGWVTIESET